MTTVTLRPRRPLEPLSLSQYTTLPLPPSPISLPNKRSLNSSPGRSAEGSTSKLRKVSGQEGGQETIRRKKSEITPRAKKALAEDEMGMGKSPARRLFVDEGLSLGISGAVLPPSPCGPSRTLDYPNSSSNIPAPSRSLAPSPPIASMPSPLEHENGATVDPHDIGFTIRPDAPMPRTMGLGTPDSRPNHPSARHILTAPPSPSSPAILQHNDQENIPPPRTTPSSTRSTPGKSSTSSARFYDDNDIVNLTGSGRKRIREKSKLNNEVHKAPEAEAEAEDDELTPGRTKGLNKGKGKQRMADELNDA